MIPLRFGDVRVEIHKGRTVTTFPDGKTLTALHAAQSDQARTAHQLGYGNDVETMNLHHDIVHSIFAYWMGEPYSGSLYAAAAKIKPTDLNWLEEAAVLEMQAYMKARGIDPILIARKITAECEA